MATLVVDIETYAPPWGDLPGITRSALTQWIDNGDFTEEERNKKLDGVRSRLALSPLTAGIVSLGVYDIERKTGAVYFVSDTPEETFTVDDFNFKQRTEVEILEDFWEGATSYDAFVTFNGRSFLLPFLYHRSAVCGVTPTVQIARQRYVTKQAFPYHVDLLDEFSFHGAMTHRPSLQLLSGAYGIPNQSLLAGDEIATAFTEKRFRYIAEKNAVDVQVINDLYEKWLKYFAPPSFHNSLEL